MKLVLAVLGLLIAFPAGWLGSALAYEWWHTYTHRFRLTVEVSTPDGLKSGSSVIEVKVTEKASWVPQSSGVSRGARGEAVFVDLGQGRNVVATLGFGPNGSADRLSEFAQQVLWRATGKDHRQINYKTLPSLSGRADVPRDLLPTLVTFDDVKEPNTARVIDPGAFDTEIAPRVRFERAWIEITDQPITNMIRAKAAWIGDYQSETAFERRLRVTGGHGGGSIAPGHNLRRGI